MGDVLRAVRSLELFYLPPQFRQVRLLVINTDLRWLSHGQHQLLTIDVRDSHSSPYSSVELVEGGIAFIVRIDILQQLTDLVIVQDVELLHLLGHVLM